MEIGKREEDDGEERLFLNWQGSIKNAKWSPQSDFKAQQNIGKTFLNCTGRLEECVWKTARLLGHAYAEMATVESVNRLKYIQ